MHIKYILAPLYLFNAQNKFPKRQKFNNILFWFSCLWTVEQLTTVKEVWISRSANKLSSTDCFLELNSVCYKHVMSNEKISIAKMQKIQYEINFHGR